MWGPEWSDAYDTFFTGEMMEKYMQTNGWWNMNIRLVVFPIIVNPCCVLAQRSWIKCTTRMEWALASNALSLGRGSDSFFGFSSSFAALYIHADGFAVRASCVSAFDAQTQLKLNTSFCRRWKEISRSAERIQTIKIYNRTLNRIRSPYARICQFQLCSTENEIWHTFRALWWTERSKCSRQRSTSECANTNIEFSTCNRFHSQFHTFLGTFSINAHAQLGHGSHGVKSAKLKYILYYRPSIVTEPGEMRRLIDIYSKWFVFAFFHPAKKSSVERHPNKKNDF